MDIGVILIAIGLGFSLAMDAFSVSLANGLHEPKMKFPRVALIAGTFAVFQGLMPLIGWVLTSTVAKYFEAVQIIIPWIAFGLLGYIGGKMIFDGIKCSECDDEKCGRLTFGLLMVQGIATSIDAMSGGVTMAAESYSFIEVLASVGIIAVMTYAICIAGIYIGKVFGMKIANKASVFGGSILVIIGIIILVRSFLG